MNENYYSYFDNNERVLKVIDLQTGEIVATEQPVQPINKNGFSVMKYTPEMGRLIVQKISEGATLTKLCKLDYLPDLATINYWKKISTSFADALEAALKDRSYILMENALDEIETIEDRDTAAIAKTKIEAYKGLAERFTPDRFSSHTKLDATISAPKMIMIDTGVPTEESENIEEADFKEILDSNNKELSYDIKDSDDRVPTETITETSTSSDEEVQCSQST